MHVSETLIYTDALLAKEFKSNLWIPSHICLQEDNEIDSLVQLVLDTEGIENNKGIFLKSPECMHISH